MATLATKFFLAPMAEITTPALRKTIKTFSDNIIMFSEMLSAGAVVSRAHYNRPFVEKHDFDDPYIYQLLGDNPERMAQAADILAENNCHGIDVNMGCSAPEINKRVQGARLLTDMRLTENIIRSCRKVLRTKLSVKIRTGYHDHDIPRIRQYINLFANEGVDFITVHPRYAKQSFKRSANWDLISQIKEISPIPVIGNGDIKDPADGINKLQSYNCDGIMIGREAIKSPWIFQLLSGIYLKKTTNITIKIRETFIQNLINIQELLPENLHKSRAHRFCMYYTKNTVFAHTLFSAIRNINSINDMIQTVSDYYERNPHEAEKKYTLKNGILAAG